MTRPFSLSMALLVTALLGLSACDSNGDDDMSPADVEGRYSFDTFVFEPSAGAIQPAMVLDTLAANDSYLELFDSGDFSLRYRFVGGTTSLIGGTFTVGETTVRLNANEDEASDLARILMPDQLTLQIDGDTLSASSDQTLDLSAFSDLYDGIPPVSGTLELVLIKD